MSQKLSDASGVMSREWLRWFSEVFRRIQAAAYDPSNVDIAGGTVGGTTTVQTTGNVTGANLSGVNTGDQTITLQGDVTGTGTGVFDTTITSNAVTYEKLQLASASGFIASSGAGLYSEHSITTGLRLIGGTLFVQSQVPIQLVPTTGFSEVVPDDTGVFIINPAGTLATGTVTMPANPVNGDVVTICATQIITALTVNPNSGQTLNGAITTIAANGFASWVYLESTSTWYRKS